MNRFPKNLYAVLAVQGMGGILFLPVLLGCLVRDGNIALEQALAWFSAGTVLLLLLTAGGVFALRAAVCSKIQWLADEAVRIQSGGAPREPLEGEDVFSRLSAVLRRMALRKRDLREAVDEHSIVAVTDRQGRITFVNDQFCRVSGYSREELLGQTHRIINSGRQPVEFFRQMWKTIATGRTWRGTIENRAKDGSHYFVATTIMPVSGTDGKPEEYIAVRTDITEQKSRSEKLVRLSQELEAKNRDLEILIRAASHDLRTPLVNVQGFASIIMDELPSLRKLLADGAERKPLPAGEGERIYREIEEAVKFISAGAEKMDSLLKGLLIFSRLGKKAPELRHLMPARIVEESLAATRFQLEAARAEVTVDQLPECLADPGLLGQVISNLIDNAIKYRDPSGPLKLLITGSRRDDTCVYRFEDNGIGIPPQHRGRIFELFHRLDASRGDGHGLGLAIVRRAMDRMGGSVEVEAASGRGTVFSITLSAGPGKPEPKLGYMQ